MEVLQMEEEPPSYQSMWQLEVDDVRNLPCVSFQFGLPVPNETTQQSDTFPIDINSTSSVCSNTYSNTSTIDQRQWNLEDSTFLPYKPATTCPVSDDDSSDTTTCEENEPVPTYQRHYNLINVPIRKDGTYRPDIDVPSTPSNTESEDQTDPYTMEMIQAENERQAGLHPTRRLLEIPNGNTNDRVDQFEAFGQIN